MPTNSFLSVFIRDEFGKSILFASFITMGIHIGGASVGLTAGLWVQRFGSKSTFVIGIFGQLLFMAALGLIPNVLWIIPLSPIAGIFLAYHWTGMQAYLIEVAPERHRGLASGIGSFVIMLSPGIAGLFLSQLAIRGGFHLFVLAAGCLIGAGFLLSLFALPKLAQISNLRLQTANKTSVEDPQARDQRKSSSFPPPVSFKMLLTKRIVKLALVIRLSSAFSFAAFNMLAGPKLIDAGGGFDTLGLFVFGGAVAGGMAQVLIGTMSDRFGRLKLLAVTAVLGIVACLTFGSADSIPILLLASSLHWFCQSAFQTLLVAFTGDISSQGELGKQMSLQTSAFSLGMVFGALVAGVLAVQSDLVPFGVTAVFLFAGLLATLSIQSTLETSKAHTPSGEGI